jgi:hypothetical protein
MALSSYSSDIASAIRVLTRAQRILKSRGLAQRVVLELNFLREVERYGDIWYNPLVINLAVARYEHLWLPLCKSREPLDPPLDITFIWHSHVHCIRGCDVFYELCTALDPFQNPATAWSEVRVIGRGPATCTHAGTSKIATRSLGYSHHSPFLPMAHCAVQLRATTRGDASTAVHRILYA